MVTIDDLKEDYFLRDIDRDFALGRRANLRYALVTTSAYLTQLNPRGPEPVEYLGYAKADISSGTHRGAINALGNAKRAVHLTIDGFLRIMGLSRAYAKANFPTRLELLQSLDAFPTQLLESLNRKRNLVEHEYIDVDVGEIVYFVEISEMFLLFAYPCLKNAAVGVCVGIEGDPRCLEWSVDFDQDRVRICEIQSQHFISTPMGPIYYKIQPKDRRSQIDSVRITQSNTEEWVPYLDLLVYCTKKTVAQLPKPSDRYHGLVISRRFLDYLSATETGERITATLHIYDDPDTKESAG